MKPVAYKALPFICDGYGHQLILKGTCWGSCCAKKHRAFRKNAVRGQYAKRIRRHAAKIGRRMDKAACADGLSEFYQTNQQKTMKKELERVVVSYVELRQILDLFGGLYFGIVRAANLAHNGWIYKKAIELAESIDPDCNVPESVEVYDKYTNDGARVEYRTRSGKQIIIDHSGEHGYYEIEVFFDPETSVADAIRAIAGVPVSATEEPENPRPARKK